MTLASKHAIGMTLAPLSWAIGFQTNYLLATSFCSPATTLIMHGISAAALLAISAGFYAAWQVWHPSAWAQDPLSWLALSLTALLYQIGSRHLKNLGINQRMCFWAGWLTLAIRNSFSRARLGRSAVLRTYGPA